MTANGTTDNKEQPQTEQGQGLADDWQTAFRAEEKNQPASQTTTDPAATSPGRSLPSLSLPSGSGKIIISLGLLCLIVLALIFFRLNNAELAQRQLMEEQSPPRISTDATNKPTAPYQPPAMMPTPAEIEMTEPVRKKWAMPSFLFSAGSVDNKLNILVSADLTLVLLLPPRENIPQNQKNELRNTIYDFFQNQPAAKLKHFALARGEMIKQLETRLRQQWPSLPLSSFMIERYYVQD